MKSKDVRRLIQFELASCAKNVDCFKVLLYKDSYISRESKLGISIVVNILLG